MTELTDGRLGDTRDHQRQQLQQQCRPSLVVHIHVAGQEGKWARSIAAGGVSVCHVGAILAVSCCQQDARLSRS